MAECLTISLPWQMSQGSEFSNVQLEFVGSTVQNVTSGSSRRLLQTSNSAVRVRNTRFNRRWF